MLKTKSVWTAIDKKADGFRLLVTRFRGRGMPASRYDAWMPNLGPSERLLRGFLAGGSSWTQFSRAYRDEVFLDGAVDKRNATIKNHGQKFTLRLIKQLAKRGNVTLLCHCAEDEMHCHRHVLRALILSNRV